MNNLNKLFEEVLKEGYESYRFDDKPVSVVRDSGSCEDSMEVLGDYLVAWAEKFNVDPNEMRNIVECAIEYSGMC